MDYGISDIRVGQGFLLGKVGFAITEFSVKFLLQSLDDYLWGKNKYKINNIVVGNDGSDWASLFTREVIIPHFRVLPLEVSAVNNTCTLPQLGWLTSDLSSSSKNKHLGIYIATDPECSDNLMIFFKNDKGHSLSEAELLSIFSMRLPKDRVLTFCQPKEVTYLDIALYSKYLKDNKLVSLEHCRPIKDVRTAPVDVMFGSSEQVLISSDWSPASIHLQGTRFSSFNPKPVYYSAVPTKQSLIRNIKPQNKNTPSTFKRFYHFAVDSLGTSLGLWDNNQSLEISKSGMFMLLIYLYSKILKKKGTVVISKGLSKRVELLCIALGVDYKIIDSGSDSFISTVGKRKRSSFLMYGDEQGRFWFKGDVVDYNPIVALFRLIELCERLNQSPGEILDVISNKYSIPAMPYSSMSIPSGVLSLLELDAKIRERYDIEADIKVVMSKTLVYSIKNDTRILLQESQNKDNIDIYIESLDLGVTKSITAYVESLLTNPNILSSDVSNSTATQQ